MVLLVSALFATSSDAVEGEHCCRATHVSVWLQHHVSSAGKYSGKADPATRLEYAAVRSRTAHEQCIGWVDGPMFSRDGASLVFTYRVGRCKAAGGSSWESSSYLFTVGADGSGLWRCALLAS